MLGYVVCFSYAVLDIRWDAFYHVDSIAAKLRNHSIHYSHYPTLSPRDLSLTGSYYAMSVRYSLVNVLAIYWSLFLPDLPRCLLRFFTASISAIVQINDPPKEFFGFRCSWRCRISRRYWIEQPISWAASAVVYASFMYSSYTAVMINLYKSF